MTGPGTDAKAAPQLRRYLTILLDLSASTNLVADAEAENYAELITELLGCYAAIIPRNGGTVVEVQGDGVLACFGYPEAHEDDGRRATDAALALHERVTSMRLALKSGLHVPLRLHTGIHSGLVLLVEGDNVRGQLSLFGTPVNIAARLSDIASADEILVSDETLGPDHHFFQTAGGESVRLQGITSPIPVHRVVGRSPIDLRFEARVRQGLTPFVGRQNELELLRQGLARASQGDPQLYVIVASPGLGKTRLAMEILYEAVMAGCIALKGYCESFLSAEPLQPFLHIVRALCGIGQTTPMDAASTKLDRRLLDMGSEVEAHRLALARLLSTAAAEGAGKPDLTSEATVLAMQALFAALARGRPVVVFIDDWQWADDLTRQVLHGIQQLSRLPILVLLATREVAPDDVQIAGAHFVPMERFSKNEAAEIICSATAGRRGILPRADHGLFGRQPAVHRGAVPFGEA